MPALEQHSASRPAGRGPGAPGAPPARAGRHRGVASALAVAIAVGAALRLPTLGLQHLWVDEATTAAIARLPPADLLDAVALFESNPPLYYVLTWAVVHVLGSGEVAVRLVPALAGIAAIPLTYAATAALATRRAGLLAAALVAVSPALVWYSQENRGYALLAPLTALSVLAWARALRGGGPRPLAGWAIAAALLLWTHYFSLFIVVPQAAWLLLRAAPRRAAALAVGAAGLAGAALLPLALAQRTRSASWVGATPLPDRVRDTAEELLVGSTLLPLGLTLLAGLLVAVALTRLRHADARGRWAAAAAGALVASGLVAPTLLALAGFDYVLSRNLVAAVVPAIVVVAIAVTVPWARRAGAALGAALLLLGLGLTVAVPLDRGLQREAFTAALAPPGGRVDEDRLRLRAQVAFAPPDRRAATTRCPRGYRAATDATSFLLTDDGHRPLAPAARLPRGWTLTRPAGAPDDAMLLVSGVCARPRAR